MKFDFDRITNAVCAETEEEKAYIKFCKQYGLPSDMLHKYIKSVLNGIIYEIIGLKKSGRVAYIIGKSGNLECFLDIRKVCNKKYYLWSGFDA